MSKIHKQKKRHHSRHRCCLSYSSNYLSTTFTQAMTLDEAKEIAQKYVPSTATFVTSEEEENKFEVMFHDDKNEEGFEVEINKETKTG